MSAGDQQSASEKQPLNVSNKKQYKSLKLNTGNIEHDDNIPKIKSTKKLIPRREQNESTKTNKKRKLNFFNKISLTYINVINYTQRRALYPFATFFSTSYAMSDTTFAWVISAFHLGGFLAIFISPYMVHAKFNLFLLTMLIILSVTNILMDIWYSFAGLIILRIISGIVCTITWSEVTGGIGAFTEAGNERTTGIIVTESSFTITTLFYVIIGVILKYSNVTWFWLIMSAMSIFGGFLTLFLPKVTLYEASRSRESTVEQFKSLSTFSLIPMTPGSPLSPRSKLINLREDRVIPRVASLPDIGALDESLTISEQSPRRNLPKIASFPDITALNKKYQNIQLDPQHTVETPITPIPDDFNKDDQNEQDDKEKEKEKEEDKFSFAVCLKAYSNVYHLMLHFTILFFMSAQFSAFSVTFGEWLVTTYGLSAAELGYFTIANTMGGVTALIITPILGKFFPNLIGIIIGTICIALMTFLISLLIWIGENKYIYILILFYLYWVASQIMFLNIIVCNLDFSPKGYESTSSLIFQMIARCASFIGTAIGTYIVYWVSFPFLINLSCLQFVIASFLYIAMYRYLGKQGAYKHLTKTYKANK